MATLRISMGIGETAALAAAFMWTLASLIWGRIRLSALGINLCKNWLGSLFLLVHLFIVAIFTGTEVFQSVPRSWVFLALSGIVGIVVGDTYYFRSLQIFGPRRALLVASTSPLFAVLLGWVFLEEALTVLALSGIALTVAGVVVVVVDRKAEKEAPGLLPGSALAGTLCGIAGALCQAAGGVFSKMGMVQIVDGKSVQICGALEATFIRLLVAAVGTLAAVFLKREWRTIARALESERTSRLIFPATALGTWLGIWLSQIAFKDARAVAIAQTLLSTCPLFAIPLVWWLNKHRTSWIGVIGTVIAFAGISLIAGRS